MAPVARDLDRTAEFHWSNTAMGELGLPGVPWASWVGRDGPAAAPSPFTSWPKWTRVTRSPSVPANLGTSPIVEFGTDEQRNATCAACFGEG